MKKKNIINLIRYHSEGNEAGFRSEAYEIAKEFELLEHNTIMDTFRQLYREEIGVVL